MDYIYIDILENIINYTNIFSSRNLILSSKNIYYQYKENQLYIDKKLAQKIMLLFQLNNYEHRLSFDCKCIFLQFHKIYNNCSSSDPIQDIIIFNISNNNLCNKCDFILFEYLLNICSINNKIYIDNKYYYNNKYKFDNNSIEYLLYYLPLTHLTYLLSITELPILSISRVISHLLNKDIENKRLLLLLDNIFLSYNNYKNIELYNQHFTSLLGELILFNKINIIKFMIKESKKYNININYRYTINSSIQNDNLILLQLFYESYINEQVLFFINIPPISLELMCEHGKFETLGYILYNILGHTINSNEYVKAVCNGIITSIQNDNFKEIYPIYLLLNYLSIDNIQFIINIFNKNTTIKN